MIDKIRHFESTRLRKDIPEFKIGDTVRVFLKIQEEGKTRLQAFEGTVISIKGSGIRKSFTVRRISYGEGVEKTFLYNTPVIDNIKVVRKGKARRAKLYYLRKRIGKKTKVEGENVFEDTTKAPVREMGDQAGT